MSERELKGIELRDIETTYAAAHGAQYVIKDLPEAIQLYREVIADAPTSREAGYSRSQLQTIARAIVPADVLLDLQVDLALAQLDRAADRALTRFGLGVEADSQAHGPESCAGRGEP